MKEETKDRLEQELLNSIDTIKEFVSSTSDLAAREVPLAAEELVNYHIAAGAFFGGGLLILALVFFIIGMVVYFWNPMKVDDENTTVTLVFAMIGCFVSTVIGMLTLNEYEVIKAWIAPRIFILEYLNSLL